MRIFASQGIRDFVLCLGYKGEVIRRYFLEYEAMNANVTVELGTNTLVGQAPERIVAEASRILDGEQRRATVPPYWDGRTAARLTLHLRPGTKERTPYSRGGSPVRLPRFGGQVETLSAGCHCWRRATALRMNVPA